MTDTTAAPARATGRAQGASRGGPTGRLTVGEYVGQLAGDAVQAVRRAGLRPGLDRSFGCDPALVGQVVDQEPVAGSELARNGMVTLYVAAPGLAPAEEDSATLGAEADEPAPATVPQAIVTDADAAQAPTRTRRSRKPGLAERRPQVFDTPPAPVSLDRAHRDEWQPPVTEEMPANTSGSEAHSQLSPTSQGEEHGDGVAEDEGDDELSREDFVVHVDDLFAGRTSRLLPGSRRVYPRKRIAWPRHGDRGMRPRLAEHRRLVKAASGMLALWAVVGVAVALAGHPAHTPPSRVISGAESRALQRASPLPDRSPAPRARAYRPPSRPTRARVHHGAPRRSAIPPLAKRAAAPREEAGVRRTASPPPAPPGPVGAAVEMGPERAQGGPFSP